MAKRINFGAYYTAVFDKRDLSDLTIRCMDRDILVHALVMRDKSSFFAKHFDAPSPVPVVEVPFDSNVVYPVVRFMYGFTSEVRYRSDILPVAHFFKLKGLVEYYILPMLQDDYFPHFADDFFEFEKRGGDASLMSGTIVRWLLVSARISNTCSMKSHNFDLVRLPLPILRKYLSSDFLQVKSELVVKNFLQYYEKITRRSAVDDKLTDCLRVRYLPAVQLKTNFVKSFVPNKPKVPRLCTIFEKKYERGQLANIASTDKPLIDVAIKTVGQYLKVVNGLGLFNRLIHNRFRVEIGDLYDAHELATASSAATAHAMSLISGPVPTQDTQLPTARNLNSEFEAVADPISVENFIDVLPFPPPAPSRELSVEYNLIIGVIESIDESTDTVVIVPLEKRDHATEDEEEPEEDEE
jgi:hypothetical protein